MPLFEGNLAVPAYRSLDNSTQEIRLLVISPGADTDILHGSLKHASLTDRPLPKYETISYSWGPRTLPSRQIRLDGRLVHITQSSEAALKCMRYSDRPRVLWIDSVCINQDLDEEKSQQVALMSTIYSLCTRNLVFLGRAEDRHLATRAVQSIRNLVADMRDETGDFRRVREVLYHQDTLENRFSDKSFAYHVCFEALEHLFRLPWFRRLWVLQEATLAPSNSCYWGNIEIDLLDTVRAARWLEYKSHHISDGLYNNAGWACAVRMFDFVDRVHGRKVKNLDGMLRVSQRFEKAEPKDSIFAILGLLRDSDSSVMKDKLMEIDYTKPLADILRDATRYALRKQDSLTPLRRVAHGSDHMAKSIRGGFPSWIVRADLRNTLQDIRSLSLFFGADTGLNAELLPADTSLGPEVLMLEGIVSDTVRETTTTCEYHTWARHPAFNSWLAEAKALNSRRTGRMALSDAQAQEAMSVELAFAISAGQAQTGARARYEDVLPLAGYIEGLPSEQNGRREESHEVVEADSSWDEESEEMRALTSLFHCHGRRFCETSSGRAGLVPRATCPGDVVAVVKGSPWPLIVRQINGDYQLVGAAYIHGIMDGEAVETARAERVPTQRLPIR